MFVKKVLNLGEKMKSLIITLSLLTLVACNKTTKEDVAKILNENPEIVFQLIENNPEKFIQSAQTAARKGNPKARNNNKEESIEEDFKNPKSPAVEESRILGDASAPVLIVEYTDLECPFCTRGNATMKEVKKLYGDKVKVLRKHLPLPMHPNAKPAALYFEAIAQSQGLELAYKWSDELFANQSKMRQGNIDVLFDSLAKDTKVDVNKVRAILKDEKKVAELTARINKDMEEARSFQIQGTPGFMINGVGLRGAYPLPMFQKVIDRVLK